MKRYAQVKAALDYSPTHTVRDALREALGWYVEQHVALGPGGGG